MSASHYVLPHINPVAISLGPLDVRWYGLMYLVGFAFAFWMANRTCDKSNGVWTRNQASDLPPSQILNRYNGLSKNKGN